jgi:hypothetical protein
LQRLSVAKLLCSRTTRNNLTKLTAVAKINLSPKSE